MIKKNVHLCYNGGFLQTKFILNVASIANIIIIVPYASLIFCFRSVENCCIIREQAPKRKKQYMWQIQ